MLPEWLPLDWVTLTIVFITIFYLYLTWNYDYWKKQNIPFIAPKLIFGNYTDALLGRTTIGEVMEDIYNKTEGKPFAGLWRFRTPTLLIREPELIREILVKEFNSFQENSFMPDPHLDPLISKNPFFQTGERWKKTRSVLTPSFTSGKLKPLYTLMQEVSAELVEYLKTTKIHSDGLEAKDLCSKYTMEMVATCGFGIKGNSFNDPDAQLRKMTRKILEPTFLRNMEFLWITLFPALGTLLNVRFIPKDVDTYYRSIVKDVVDQREKTGTMRNDYLQNLINLKKKGTESGQEYSDEDITAHTVTFLTDGFETSSIVLSFCMYDLACHPEFQEGIRKEVAEARQAADGQLTYEALLEMPLLDQVLQESLRMHAPLLNMEKICTRDTTLRASDGTTVNVPKGMMVVVPIRGLHADPRFFTDPHRFDPTRWSPQRKDEVTKYSFLPFGEGPRMCLGMRFAILQIKLALASTLEHFEIKTTPKTPKKVIQDPNYFLACAKGGLWITFVPRKAVK